MSIDKHKIEILKSEISMLQCIDANEEHIDIIYDAVDGLSALLRAMEEGKITNQWGDEEND